MTEAITQTLAASATTTVDGSPRRSLSTANASMDEANKISISADQLQSAATALTQAPQAKQTDLRFQVDKLTEQLVVSVVDGKDGKVLLQMPSAEALSIAQSIETQQMQLLHRKA